MKKYKTILAGGTFDHFHKGHREFLSLAASLGEAVVLGITSNEYVENKRQSLYQTSLDIDNFETYTKRKSSVIEFLKNKGMDSQFHILKIDDAFGPSLRPKFDLDAIIVSTKTAEGADLVNRQRQKARLPSLEVILAHETVAEDGIAVSSERIRNGEIDREGRLYIKPYFLQKTLHLPQKLREELRQPVGKILGQVPDVKNRLIITIGDITTKSFLDKGYSPCLAVVDLKVKRKQIFQDVWDVGFGEGTRVFEEENPAGEITPGIFRTIKNAFDSIDEKSGIVIKVNGEDDLSVLPAVLAAPLGSYVFYGQPDEGIAQVLVDEKIKDKIRKIVEAFDY